MTQPPINTGLDAAPAAGGDAQAIIDAARLAAEPFPLDLDTVYSVATPQGVVQVDPEVFRSGPRRHRGQLIVHDAASFLAVWDKFGGGWAEVWADTPRFTVTAVFNAGDVDVARWRDHRCVLKVVTTPEWAAWEGHSGRLMPQVEFAEHLEDHLPDITSVDGGPSGADMLEIAQSFQATTSVSFESAQRLASGERQLSYREDTQASAGKKGQITIPERFTLALRPFEGADPYKVTARLRYRIGGGNLTIGYVLDRPDDVLRAAFGDIVAAIQEGVGPNTRVLAGQL